MLHLEAATDVRSLLRKKNFHALKPILETWQSADIAELISLAPEEDQALLFKMLPNDIENLTFEQLKPSLQKRLLVTLEQIQVKDILNRMPPDNRTFLLKNLPPDQVTELIELLEPEKREVALNLLGFPEYSVGRLMSPHYIACKKEWTIRQLWDYIRQHGSKVETLNVIYVIDDDGKLIDDIMVRDILLSQADAKVSSIMDYKYVKLDVDQEQEEAIPLFKKHGRVALPVVDKGYLIGIVTVDDILKLARAEDTEDIQKMGGTEALDEPYMQIPLSKMILKRASWLVILFLGEMLTATAMANYQDEIAKAVVLSLFIPLIISSGGNSGSQASTLIIRAMALGEVTLGDWWRIMRREILSGLILGGILGSIGFLRITIWSAISPVYGAHWLLIAFVVTLSLIGVVMWGSLSGSMLPLLIKRLGGDPATSSAPFIATLVDVTGLIIYFSIAMVILNGVAV